MNTIQPHRLSTMAKAALVPEPLYPPREAEVGGRDSVLSVDSPKDNAGHEGHPQQNRQAKGSGVGQYLDRSI